MNRIEDRIKETSMSNNHTLQGIIGLVVGVAILNEIMETIGINDNPHESGPGASFLPGSIPLIYNNFTLCQI
jgi:hypothetical protein